MAFFSVYKLTENKKKSIVLKPAMTAPNRAFIARQTQVMGIFVPKAIKPVQKHLIFRIY